MSNHMTQTPFLERNAGDLITAEDWNEMQQLIKSALAENAEGDAENIARLEAALADVDATRFGGKTPQEWTEEYDKRYIKRDDAIAAGEYRRYFKQADRLIVGPAGTQFIEPVVIEHNLCRFPIMQVYALQPLFPSPLPGDDRDPPFANQPFDVQDVRFLVYYASKRDPVAEHLRTESSDWFYWGDHLYGWLDYFGIQPAESQSFDDLLNDFWGAMFNPGLEQDQFRRDSYGHTAYVERWIQDDKTVGDLVREGRWDDLRVAIRPVLLSSGMQLSLEGRNTPQWWNTNAIYAIHLSQNAVEIRVPHAMDLMVLLRS